MSTLAGFNLKYFRKEEGVSKTVCSSVNRHQDLNRCLHAERLFMLCLFFAFIKCCIKVPNIIIQPPYCFIVCTCVFVGVIESVILSAYVSVFTE